MANNRRIEVVNDQDNDNLGNGNLYVDTGMSAVTLGAKLTQLQNIQSKFQLFDQFSHDLQSNPLNVSYLRDRWNDLVGNAQAMCTKTTNIMKSTEVLSPQNVKDILDEVQQAKVQMASSMVMFGAIASAAIILVQVWRLREVWSAVKDAENVVDESRSKMNAINANINQLNNSATELQGFIENYENGTSSDHQKKKLMKSIRLKISRMSTTYVDTRSMISEIKVLVDGKRQVLAVYQREQISNGIMNSVHGFTNLVQSFQFSGLLSTGLMVMQCSITAAFFGLAIGNGAMYCITGKTMNQVRQALRQIDHLEGQLRGILHTIHEAEDWVAVNDE